MRKNTIDYRMASNLMTMKNHPNISNWNRVTGYRNGSIASEYPNRVIGAGQKYSLDLLLSHNDITDFNFKCGFGLNQDFSIYISRPGETLKNFDVIGLRASEHKLVTIRPRINDISKVVESYPLYQRNCFLTFERRLRFFKQYTQMNCESECIANLTRKECGCVGFFMPSTTIRYMF